MRRLLTVVARAALLASLAMLLALLWLVTGVAGLSTLDDVCAREAPVDSSIIQDGSLWPPRLSCRYETPNGLRVEQQDSAVRIRVIFAATTGALAVVAFVAAAVVAIRWPVERVDDVTRASSSM